MGSAGAMPLYTYRHSGCLVLSELELPEWHAFAVEDSDETDVAIRFAEALGEAAPPDHVPVMEGEALRFAVPEVGTWRISGGRLIEVEPFGEPTAVELRLFTLGSAWGTLGYQRGWAMLHGSAVLGPKGAVLFCGPQGAGKSTMAAALAVRGLPLVSDDLSRVVPGRADRGTLIYPSSTRHKLWTEAIDTLELGGSALVQDYFRAEKFHLETRHVIVLDQPVPLVAVYALEFGERLASERLSGSGAATAVLKETIYRPLFLEAMGRLAEQAVYAARIAATVPIHRLTRPRDLAQLDRVCEHLLAAMGED